MARSFKERLEMLVGNEQPFAWAAKIGISKGAFSRIWHEGAVPKHEHLLKIKYRTGASLDWLLAGEGLPPPSVMKIEEKQRARGLAFIEGRVEDYKRLDKEIEEAESAYYTSIGEEPGAYAIYTGKPWAPDLDLLEAVVQATEQALIDNKATSLSPDKRARLVRIIYEFYLEEFAKHEPEDRRVDMTNVVRFVRAANL